MCLKWRLHYSNGRYYCRIRSYNSSSIENLCTIHWLYRKNWWNNMWCWRLRFDHGYVEHSSNYSDTLGSLWFYSKNRVTNFNADVVITNAFKSFQYKAKLLRDTVDQSAPNLTNWILNKKIKYCRAIKISK